MARLAIFEGTLDAAEINRRYGQWTKTRHLDREVNHRGATYEFAAPDGDFVRTSGKLDRT